MWDKAYTDAYILGVDYTTFWELEPRYVIDICDKKMDYITKEKEESILQSWYTAYSTAVGFHNPKQLKRPDFSKKEEESEEMTDDELIKNLISFKNKHK